MSIVEIKFPRPHRPAGACHIRIAPFLQSLAFRTRTPLQAPRTNKQVGTQKPMDPGFQI